MSIMRKKIAEHMVITKRTSAHVHSVFEVDSTAVARCVSKKADYEARRQAHLHGVHRQGRRRRLAPSAMRQRVDRRRQHRLPEGHQPRHRRGARRRPHRAGGHERRREEPARPQPGRSRTSPRARAPSNSSRKRCRAAPSPSPIRACFGTLFGLPIINQPQVAILGVGGIEKRVAVIDDAIAMRPWAIHELGYDHRLVDGAVADQFMPLVKRGSSSSIRRRCRHSRSRQPRAGGRWQGSKRHTQPPAACRKPVAIGRTLCGRGDTGRDRIPPARRAPARHGRLRGGARAAASLVERAAPGDIPDTLLLLQHPHVVTLGVKREQGRSHIVATPDALAAQGREVHETGRGGDVTYHGPGQLVGYPIFDLAPDRCDVHRYVRDLEEAMIRARRDSASTAGRVAGLTGVWVGTRRSAPSACASRGGSRATASPSTSPPTSTTSAHRAVRHHRPRRDVARPAAGPRGRDGRRGTGRHRRVLRRVRPQDRLDRD